MRARRRKQAPVCRREEMEEGGGVSGERGREISGRPEIFILCGFSNTTSQSV